MSVWKDVEIDMHNGHTEQCALRRANRMPCICGLLKSWRVYVLGSFVIEVDAVDAPEAIAASFDGSDFDWETWQEEHRSAEPMQKEAYPLST